MHLLILDLDETLIHGTRTPLEREADFTVGGYHVYRRPHLSEFLVGCFDDFEVAVWTSSTMHYATAIVKNIITTPDDLAFLWARERCTRRFDSETRSHYWIKDLKKVKRRGYSLDEVIMVDDTPSNLERNFGNHVGVTEWTGAPDDDELLRLGAYLKEIRHKPNIRKIEKRYWRSQV
jgi:RNA polymerase II subunit A small phosphatase-like protein